MPMKTKSFSQLHITCIVILTIIIFSFSCKPEQRISNGIFTFTVGNVILNGKPAKIGDSVIVNDSIQTGNKSFAVIQFGNSALLKLNEGSSLKVTSLESGKKDEIKLFLQYGNAFNRIVKKGSEYTIKTPTMVAAVRGTTFSIIQKKDSDNGRCLVLEGSVNVGKSYEPGGTGQQEQEEQKESPVSVGGGYLVNVSGEEVGEPVALESSEKSELETLKEIRIIEELPEAQVPDRKEIIIKNPVMPGTKAVSTMPSESKGTGSESTVRGPEGAGSVKTVQEVYLEKLNSIKVRNHGKLDKITLRDGRSFLGMIYERGLVYKIETPRGVHLVPQDDIVTQTIQY